MLTGPGVGGLGSRRMSCALQAFDHEARHATRAELDGGRQPYGTGSDDEHRLSAIGG